MECQPIPKPGKRPKKNKREPNPQKTEWSRIIDPAAIEAAKRDYCVHCGITKAPRAEYYEVHHIVRRSQGGDDVPENLANICKGPGTNFCHERAGGMKVDGRPPITADHLREMVRMDLLTR